MRNNRSMRNFMLAIVLLFPVLSNLFEHASTVLLMTLTLFGLHACFCKENRPSISFHQKVLMWAFASYFLIYLLSFTVNGALGNLESLRVKYIGHEFRMLLFIPVFFLFRKIHLPVSVLWMSVVSGAILSGIHAIVFGVFLYPGERVFGSYHSIAFGHLSLTMACMSLASIHFFRQKQNPAWAVCPWIAFLLGMTASILSGTRGAWIAIPALLLMAAIQYYRDLQFRTWLGIAAGIFLAAMILYEIPQTQISLRIQLTIQEIRDYDGSHSKAGSASERLEGWKAAWNIFSEHPLLGAGPGSFGPITHEMVDRGERSEIIKIYHQPHSAYLSVMSDCGILGLISLLAVFLVPAYGIIGQIRKTPESRDAGFAGFYLIAAFMQFGLTETIFGQNIYVGFYLVMTAAVLCVCSGHKVVSGTSL